jgi:trimeric autotransporter adhesin
MQPTSMARCLFLYLEDQVSTCRSLDRVVKSENSTFTFSGIGEPESVYGKVTYIFLIDTSASTIKYQAQCGKRGDTWEHNKVLDCEIAAVEEIQRAVLQSGNVDLEGLAWFGTTGGKINQLFAPWDQTVGKRDSLLIENVRRLVADGVTNYEEGVIQACELARSPMNDNPNTVIIMVSDGKPNRGQSVKDLIQTNCANAIFQNFAVTELADCNAIDTDGLGPGDAPDTLYQIGEYSGGSCTKVPDVTQLPFLLMNLEKTTWDGVRVLINGVEDLNAVITYKDSPGFQGPKETTYDVTFNLSPGEYEVCLEATSSTSGIPERLQKCTMINVVSLSSSNENFSVSPTGESTATFDTNIAYLGPKTGCSSDLSGKKVTVKTCDGTQTLITDTITDTSGKVTIEYSYDDISHTSTPDCLKSCMTDAANNVACTETIIEWEVSNN